MMTLRSALTTRAGRWILVTLGAFTLFVVRLQLDAIEFPTFTSWRGTTEAGVVQSTTLEATVGGATFRVTSVLSDPEQTVLGYTVEGGAKQGGFVTVLPGPRLVLSDGTVIELFGNAPDPEVAGGHLVFPGVPEGNYTATLEMNGIRMATGDIAKRFALPVPIDNGEAFKNSARNVLQQAERSPAASAASLTIREVTRTPSMVTVRGTFDSLTVDQIQHFGTPDVWLTDAHGTAAALDRGRWGFGADYRDFEFRFALLSSGPATLELRAFETGQPRGRVAPSAFGIQETTMTFDIP